MSSLDVLQRLRAVDSGRAQPRTRFLHRHLKADPLVVVVYRLAGESAAPLGLMFGTKVTKPTLLVAPEPRSRQIRFEQVFNPFGVALVDYVRGCAEIGEGGITRTAPQLLVANGATADFVGDLMGRSLRYLQTTGEFAVPETTVEAGAHLTWLGNQEKLPGSSVLLAATQVLRRHWVCGISDLESEDLHVQLAWIDPPGRRRGSGHAAAIEADRFAGVLPAAGPTSDPSWDRDVLDPLIGEFNTKRNRKDDPRTVRRLGGPIRQAVEAALTPTWEATWRAIELLRGLPVADSVEKRWTTDRKDFTQHMGRFDQGEPVRFRVRDSAKQSAYIISRRESAQAGLEAAEALDDPLVMAAAVADGVAFSGTVTEVDRPLVTLELARPCPVPEGAELYWTPLRGKCSVVVQSSEDDGYTVVLETRAGKTKHYPDVGDLAVYCPFTENTIPPPKMPTTVPWTHQGPYEPAAAGEVPE